MRVVLVTCPRDEAERIAEDVLQARLAACVSIVSRVESRYWWQGKLHRDEESLLIMKTDARCAAALVNRVKSAHPYEVPEVVCVEVREANRDYLAWITESCRPGDG